MVTIQRQGDYGFVLRHEAEDIIVCIDPVSPLEDVDLVLLTKH